MQPIARNDAAQASCNKTAFVNQIDSLGRKINWNVHLTDLSKKFSFLFDNETKIQNHTKRIFLNK